MAILEDVKLHRVTHRDVEQVVEIDQLSFDECVTVGIVDHLLDQNDTVGAWIDDQLLGFVMYRRGFHYNDNDDPDHALIHVSRLAVHPSTRHRGIGRLLVDHVRRAATIEKRQVVMSVWTDDTSIGPVCFLAAVGFMVERIAGSVSLYKLLIKEGDV